MQFHRTAVVLTAIGLSTMILGSQAIGIDQGQRYAVGAVAWPHPALSVRVSQGALAKTAWHLTTTYGDDGAAFSGDYQKLFVPRFGQGIDYRSAIYTGIGLQGESRYETASQESYHMRFPAGIQVEVKPIHLQIFTEAAALIGPLPATGLGSNLLCGLRASF